MSREDYLKGLEEALTGEVSASVIRENVNYYNSYISQEMKKGRTMEEIVDEIGEPRIVARTIIDSGEAASETERGYGGSYEDGGYGNTYDADRRRTQDSIPHIHYFDLSKWYWKLIITAVVLLVAFVVFRVVGGIFVLLIRFAGPILMILLLYWFIKGQKR